MLAHAPAVQGFNLASPRPGGGPPSGRPTSELLGSATFQTPEGRPPTPPYRFFLFFARLTPICFFPADEEMAAASLDVNFKEELSAMQPLKVLSEAERTATLYMQIRFFITVLQQMARSDPMTALLSLAVEGSMQSQMEAKLASMNLKSPRLKSNIPSSPSARTFNTSATNRHSLAFDSSNAAHRISATALATSGERGTWASVSPLGLVAERDNSPTQDIFIEPRSSHPQSTDFSGLSGHPAFRSPRPDGASLDAVSPAMGDSWASMVNMPLLPMFRKSSTADNNASSHDQTVDLATATLNNLYGGNVPRLDGPEKFRHGSSTDVNNGIINNGIYGDNGDLISGQHAPGIGRVPNASSRGGSGLRNGGGGGRNWSGRFGGSNDGSSAMAAAHQQAALANLGMGAGGFNLGLGSPGLGGMPNGLNMAQLAQLNGMTGMNTGMNPFNMNMLGMANLSAMGISPEAQHLAAQIAAAGGGFGQANLAGLGGLGGFGGLQSGMGGSRGPSRSGGRSPGLSANGKSGSSSAGNGSSVKKDEEDFDPAVLSDVAGWLRTLRLHKYTPNFEGMSWKDMVVMDEQALEAQGVAALGARRKMLKTFEVVRRKMGIDDPTALPPPPPPSGGPASSSGSTLGSSAGSGGGMPSA
ncbi:hypothetical protein V8E53_011532 [Lactarius tabidus]